MCRLYGSRFLTTFFLCLAALSITINGAQAAPVSNSEQSEIIREFLEQIAGEWNGILTVQTTDGERHSLPVQFVLTANDNGYSGPVVLPGEKGISFIARDEGERWETSLNGLPIQPMIACDAQGECVENSLFWCGPETALTITLLGETQMDMVWSGRWRLPDGLVEGEVQGITARLRKQGFRLKIGPFELVIMEFVGIFATLFFASRFVIQWIASERAKKSVMPELFWWVSLIGSGLMLIYAIYFGRLAVLLGQLTGWTVYVRNIWLIEREKRQRRQEAKQEE